MSGQLRGALELIGCQLVNDTIHILQMQGLASEDAGEFTSIPRQYIDQTLQAIEDAGYICVGEETVSMIMEGDEGVIE